MSEVWSLLDLYYRHLDFLAQVLHFVMMMSIKGGWVAWKSNYIFFTPKDLDDIQPVHEMMGQKNIMKEQKILWTRNLFH